MSGSTVNIANSTGQKVDTIFLPDGSKRLKLAVGTKDISTDSEDAAWQAAATHANAATFATSDGVVVGAGVEDGGTTVRKHITDATGRPLVIAVPTQGNLTDRSGTITTGGTRQQVAAALTTRKYFFFQNHSDTVMWINFGVNAVADQPSIQVPVGGTFAFPSGFCSTQSIDVICATTGKKFTAKEG